VSGLWKGGPATKFPAPHPAGGDDGIAFLLAILGGTAHVPAGMAA